jgi:hypothetical protein
MLDARAGRATPDSGPGGDKSSHLLALQQPDVQISLGLPSRAGNVTQPGDGKG